MPALIIHSGKHQGKKLLLPQADIVIGRDEVCQIRLGSSDVSRRHCVLRPSGEGFLVRDLNSRNGTLINGRRIESETRLEPGDLLQVGPISFLVPGPKAAKPAAGAQPIIPAENSRRSGPGAMTDEEIAAWLTYDETDSDKPTGGTTIISGAELEQRKQEAPPASDAPGAATGEPEDPAAPRNAETHKTPPRGETRKFRSVADEAQDVIGRWMDQAENE